MWFQNGTTSENRAFIEMRKFIASNGQIIDNQELYHCGASIKDLGRKCFAISKVENQEIINMLKNII